MRRIWIIAVLPLLFVACKRGENSMFASRKQLDAPVQRPGSRDPKTGKYIPPVCAADGSYEKARDCFRKAEVIRFRMDGGQGTVTREAPGAERMMLYVVKGGQRGNWLAVTTPTGVIWSFNGAKAPKAPPDIEQIFQWVTRFPDAQKKEGAPRLVGRDAEAITYEFTDAGSGAAYVVKVNPKTGLLLGLSGAGMDLKFG